VDLGRDYRKTVVQKSSTFHPEGHIMSRFLFSLVLAVLTPLVGFAAPFNSSHIPADAKWVAHIDLEAIRASVIGKAMREHWLAKEKVQGHLDKVRDEIGMDPSEDILSATLYDTKYEKHHGVLMITVQNADGQKLLARLNEKEPHNRMVEFEGAKLYLWTKGGKHPHTVCGTLYDNRVMILSRDVIQVTEVLDVLNGKKPALSSDSPLAASTPAGTTLLMRGIDLADARSVLRCPVLKESNWFELETGANAGKSFMNMTIDTDSDEVASNAKGVIDGFRALISLKHGKENLKQLLSNLEVSTEGETISATWSADETAVLESIKAMVAKHKKHKGGWHKGGWHKKWREKH